MKKTEPVQLPIFLDPELGLLPTQKVHTSFSELSTWNECSWRHMLGYVNKIEGDKGSIHTSFGKTVHDAIEHFLRDGKLHTDSEIVDIFKRELDGSEVEISDKDFESFVKSAIRLKNEFPDWFKAEFPEASVFAIEHKIFDKIPELDTRYFKGFIDCVLKVPKVARKNSKKPAEGFNYLIVDWKGQRLSAPILTPSGWTTMGELKVGDIICASNGLTSIVEGIFPLGKRDVYRVHFRDGTVVDTTDDHLWKVISVYGTSKVLTTKELMTEKNYKYVPVPSNPIEFIETSQNLPVPPYLLGVLLGDGHLGKKSVSISTKDKEILDKISVLLPEEVSLKHTQKYDFRLSVGKVPDGTFGKNHKNPLLNSIRTLGLNGKLSHEKFIPEQYLFSSPADRLSIVQGLLDTDGWVQKGVAKFSTTSPSLAEGMKHLVCSLGGVAFISTRKKKRDVSFEEKVEFIVTVRLPEGMKPFRLSRKLVKWNSQPYHKLCRKISKVELLPEQDDMQCIGVSAPDHLYITNDFVLTHNTCSWGWNVEKKRDPMKIAQLAFYKHFFSTFFNVPLSDIKVAFVLAKRTPKADTSPFEVVPISVGQGTIEKGLKLLKSHLISVDKRLYMKNRNSCRFCAYKDTQHCV